MRRCLHGAPEGVGLREMYRDFVPAECCQGLPPRSSRVREEWLTRLLGDRLNVVAVVEQAVVGHAAILDMGQGQRCEYLVFIHQDHQNRGIGTALTREVKRLATELGYRRVWLSVEARNDRAIHVYRKTGFCFVGQMDSELEMEAPLGFADRQD